MKKHNLTALISVLFIMLPSLVFAGENGNKLFETIAARKQLFAKYYNAGDAAALTGMYTSDATVIAPNFGPAKGHEEIRAGFDEELALGDGKIGLKTLEVERISKDTAWELGFYTLTIKMAEGDPIFDEGHYVIIWKRDEHKVWKLHVDTWNTSLPLE